MAEVSARDVSCGLTIHYRWHGAWTDWVEVGRTPPAPQVPLIYLIACPTHIELRYGTYESPLRPNQPINT